MIAAKPLQKALSRVCVASLRLHYGISQPRPAWTAKVMSELGRSASTLTAVHGLPLRTRHELGLPVFTQLRALTLHATGNPPDILRASDLPLSLRDITLDAAGVNESTLPWFAGFDRLLDLRSVTLLHYDEWQLGTWDDAKEQRIPLQLPPNFEV